MLAKRTTTKILVDGGNPEETSRIKQLLGFVDGQTTNPSLIAKNPEIRKLVASGHPLGRRKRMKSTSASFSVSLHSSATPVFRLRFSPISTPPLSRCWSRVRKCSPGYRMHLLNTPA